MPQRCLDSKNREEPGSRGHDAHTAGGPFEVNDIDGRVVERGQGRKSWSPALEREEIRIGGETVGAAAEPAGEDVDEARRLDDASWRAEDQRVHRPVEHGVRAGADREARNQHPDGQLRAPEAPQGVPEVIVHRCHR